MSLLSSLLGVAGLASVPSVRIAPGVDMPLLNFGFQKDHAAAIRLGVRGIDTALVYGDHQQREVGRAVAESGVDRTEFFVTTKIPCCPGNDFTNRSATCRRKRDPNADVEHDLKMLGMEYVDLLLLHWPCDDPKETLAVYRSLEAYAAAGKARAIGVSNFNASQLATLRAEVLASPPAVDQCGFSIAGHTDSTWGRDDATHAACAASNCTYSAYSPLGGWAKGGTSHVLNDPTVKSVAAAHNRSTAQVALRWVVQQGIVAVTSSDNLDHIQGDLEVFDFALTDEEMTTLAQVQLALM